LRELGRLEEAAEVLRKILTLKPVLRGPRFANCYHALGLCLEGLEKPAEAEEAYRKAVAHNPSHTWAYFNLGNLLREQGKLPEAVDALRKAIELKPDYTWAYFRLGEALREQGKLAEANDTFHKILVLKPDLAGRDLTETHLHGLCLQQLGKPAEAE